MYSIIKQNVKINSTLIDLWVKSSFIHCQKTSISEFFIGTKLGQILRDRVWFAIWEKLGTHPLLDVKSTLNSGHELDLSYNWVTPFLMPFYK